MEVLTWVCPRCKKELKSLYQGQLDTNRRHHEMTHQEAKNEEDKKDGDGQD